MIGLAGGSSRLILGAEGGRRIRRPGAQNVPSREDTRTRDAWRKEDGGRRRCARRFGARKPSLHGHQYGLGRAGRRAGECVVVGDTADPSLGPMSALSFAGIMGSSLGASGARGAPGSGRGYGVA